MKRIYDDKHQGLRGNLRNSSGWTPQSRPTGFGDSSRSHQSRMMSKDSRMKEDEVQGRELGRNDEVRLVSLAAKRNHWVPPSTSGSGGSRQTQEQNHVSQKALNAKIRDLEDQNKVLMNQVEYLKEKNVDLMNEVRALKLEKVDCERKLERYRRVNFDSHPNTKSGGVSSNVDTGGDRFLPGQRIDPSFISHRAPAPEYDYRPNTWTPPAAEDYRRNPDKQLPYQKRAEYREHERPTERASWREHGLGSDDYFPQQQTRRGREPIREQRPGQDADHYVNPNSRFDGREERFDGREELLNKRVGFEHYEEDPEPDRRRFESSTRTEDNLGSGPKGWNPIGRDSTQLGKPPAEDSWGGNDAAPRRGGSPKRKEDSWGTPQETTRASDTEDRNAQWSGQPRPPRQPVHWSPPANQRPSKETSEYEAPVNRSSYASGEKRLSESNDRQVPKASPTPVKPAHFSDPVTPSSSDAESDTNEPAGHGWRNPGSV